LLPRPSTIAFWVGRRRFAVFKARLASLSVPPTRRRHGGAGNETMRMIKSWGRKINTPLEAEIAVELVRE
jgi:hypothetical protein